MLASFQNSLTLLGRLLMAWMFLPAAIGKITGFSGTVAYSASMGLPMPEVGTAVAVVVELLGSVALILGFGTRWAALALAFFTLVASFFFHNYWALPAEQQMMQELMFMKNMAIVGGLLTMAAWGAGAWSLEAKLGR
ncbi:LysR family transcriptional regulator [Polaromonas sp.]|nr:LysR family transcriptional regulator [Polaromonas sp.]